MRAIREYQDAFEREVRHWPCAEIAFTQSSKHQKLIIRYLGKEAERIFSTSASDHRAVKNAVSDMRRTLRSFGAVRVKNANDN